MNMKELHNKINGLSLLYVEDEPEIRGQTALFFKKFFKIVDVAQNGADGLELFSKNFYDVVITDLKMPKMSGETMLENIIKIKPDVLTVVMSGVSGANEAWAHKSDFFIQKPAGIDMLIETMVGIADIKK